MLKDRFIIVLGGQEHPKLYPFSRTYNLAENECYDTKVDEWFKIKALPDFSMYTGSHIDHYTVTIDDQWVWVFLALLEYKHTVYRINLKDQLANL